jgi:hypothetical protein
MGNYLRNHENRFGEDGIGKRGLFLLNNGREKMELCLQSEYLKSQDIRRDAE